MPATVPEHAGDAMIDLRGKGMITREGSKNSRARSFILYEDIILSAGGILFGENGQKGPDPGSKPS